MALQTSIIYFTGKLYDKIGFRRNGNYFFRSVPAMVHQTDATRRAAKRFGVASRRGALIRHAFSELDLRSDTSHINRLNRTLILAGGDPKAVTGFQFNKAAGIDRFFTKAPKLSRDGILHILPQQLLPYKGRTTVEVKVIAARLNFAEHRIVGHETASFTLDLREPFAGTSLSLDVPGEGLLVVTLQVSTSTGSYLAAGIIAVQEARTVPFIRKRIPTGYQQPTLAEGHQQQHLVLRE